MVSSKTTRAQAPDFDYGLFGRLRRDAAPAWAAYIGHPFVKALGRGTLPQPWFQNFLIQDYLYLIQYARGYALAGYKSESLSELVAANRTMTALLEVEMPLHVAYCREWGISQPELEGAPPDLRMTAYANFFLERGASGDRLDLEIAVGTDHAINLMRGQRRNEGEVDVHERHVLGRHAGIFQHGIDDGIVQPRD